MQHLLRQMLAVWLSDNGVAHINKVPLCQAGLVLHGVSATSPFLYFLMTLSKLIGFL